jgi:predicted RNA-binding Zn ribbon-like protein
VTFAHDTEAALVAAVALVNSADDPDTLTTVDALAEFYVEHDYTGRHDRTTAELEEVTSIRAELRQMLTAERDTAVELVNRMLAEVGALPRLVRHGTVDWHIHAIDADRSLADRMRVETAMAMVDVIRTDELSRLSVCADPDCEGIVLDLSRNRSRRFCSTTCGNRAAVAAYRARQSGS